MKKFMISFLVILAMLLNVNVFSQGVGINADGSEPNYKAILDVKSITKGFLMPRLTKVQRDAVFGLGNSEIGMLIFQTDNNTGFYFWNGSVWIKLSEEPTLLTDATNKTVEYQASSFDIKVGSNISWTVTDNADWISLSASSNNGNATLTANYTENTTIQRIAQITFSGNGVSNIIITVTQNINPILTDIDNNIYNTVQIGTQIWMKENLKVIHYSNNVPIIYVTNNSTWTTQSTGAYCWYNNDISNKDIYGALYNWYTVADSRGICPIGWHIPSDIEWTALTDYLGGESVASSKMKEIGTAHWLSPNDGATNESGFTALPGGGRTNNTGAFVSLYSGSNYWSSTLVTSYSWSRSLYVSDPICYRYQSQRALGFSVRCVKN